MEYLDTKVLESLMIDESMIATESFSSKLKAIASKALQIAKTFFKGLINIIRKIISSIKEKSRIKKEIGKDAVRMNSGLFISIFNNAKQYASYTQKAVSILWCPTSKSIEDIRLDIQNYAGHLEQISNNLNSQRITLMKKYGDKNCYIDADAADKILKECFELNQSFEKAYKTFDEIANKEAYSIFSDPNNSQLHDNITKDACYFANGVNNVLSILSTIQKYITNATYDYGDKNPKVIDTRISDD